MKKVYYAHSVGIYNTQQEARDIETLEGLGFEVINPNTPQVQEEVIAWKTEHGDNKVMVYFDNILFSCDAIAFRPHPDGKIGSGVWYEIKYMKEQGKPVIELPNFYSTRILSLDDTREYLRLSGNR